MCGNVFYVLAVTEIAWLEYCGNNNETVIYSFLGNSPASEF